MTPRPSRLCCALRAIVSATILAAAGCAVPAPEPADSTVPVRASARPDLSGSWELDFSRSENPGDKLRYLYEVTRSHYSQQLRRDGNPGVAMAAMADLQGLIDLGRLAEIITKPMVLTIRQTDSDIRVARDGDYALTCDFLSRAITGDALGLERCGWQRDELVFEVALPDGLHVIHRLVLSDDGTRLNVATTVAADDVTQAFSVNRVYMPFEPGQNAFDCETTVARTKTCTLGRQQ